MVFWCFQGIEKVCIGNEWVKKWFKTIFFLKILRKFSQIFFARYFRVTASINTSHKGSNAKKISRCNKDCLLLKRQSFVLFSILGIIQLVVFFKYRTDDLSYIDYISWLYEEFISLCQNKNCPACLFFNGFCLDKIKMTRFQNCQQIWLTKT